MDRIESKVAKRLIELRKAGPQYRNANVGSVDVESRTVELAFSSETEYERWWGVEILSHEPESVKLERLNNKAPLLWMHDWDDQRGVVESARIDTDRMGRAVVRLSKSEKGEELLQDMADGIITKVSVGYAIHGMKLTEEREDVDVYTVTDWEPLELSMVSIPADDTVGIGRTFEKTQEEQKPENNQDEAVTQTERMIVKMPEDQKEALEAATKSGSDAERARMSAIAEMGKQYKQTDMAMEFIAEGRSAADFQRALLSTLSKRVDIPLSEQGKGPDIGLTEKEIRQFSIFKAIRALDKNATKSMLDAAAFEFECSRAASQRYGKETSGVIIPNDVLNHERAFGTGANGTTGNGSAVVATNMLAGSFIDILRKKAWVMRRARSLAGLVGNVDIPKQVSSTQGYWVGEMGAPTASAPGVDQISFTPKTLGAFTDISRRLLMQSTPDAEMLVRDDLLAVMALEIDRVAIYGTGGEYQPKGLKYYSGINAVDFATAGAPSYAELVEMETQIALDNADVNSMSYAFNAAVRGKLKTTLQFPSVNGSNPIWELGGTVNGYSTDTTNQIASGEVFFGNWKDLVIAMWGGLELTVDPYSNSTSGALRIVTLQDVDLNLRRLESFCYGSDTVA
jgi:HK97 family phage major capsid protein/HK97 family phage prohead protease